MAARVADFCQTVDDFDACILDEKELKDEGIVFGSPAKAVSISCPGEDIWQKFTYPPTPPRSPQRSPVKSVCEFTQQEPTPADRLQLLSDILDNDVYDNRCCSLNTINWKTKIIQDCMWNGTVEDRQRKYSVEDEDSGEDLYPTPCSTPPLLDYSSTDCVDPSTVFPGCTFNDSCSCSSFSDSDEEIDVVTVDKPVSIGLKRKLSAVDSRSLNRRRSPVALKRARSHPGHVTDAGFHDYTSLMSPSPKPMKESQQQQPQQQTSSPISPKRKSFNFGHSNHSSHSKTRSSISMRNAASSRRDRMRYDELDPETKRATHNVLERKRRNDLKFSFQSLRNAVPSLKGSDKTPKVIILRKASDYIRSLKTDGDKLLQEKEHLRKKQQDMLKKYVSLSKEKCRPAKKS